MLFLTEVIEHLRTQGDLSLLLEGVGAHRGVHLLPFQWTFLHGLLRKLDRFGDRLLPLMINSCICCRKPR